MLIRERDRERKKDDALPRSRVKQIDMLKFHMIAKTYYSEKYPRALPRNSSAGDLKIKENPIPGS